MRPKINKLHELPDTERIKSLTVWTVRLASGMVNARNRFRIQNLYSIQTQIQIG